jgi:urease accessory protein
MPEPGDSPDALALLGALQLGDSFFPAGLYTLSHGLESFVQAGAVQSPEDLASLLEDYVVSVGGPSDAVAAAAAATAVTAGEMVTLIEIDRRLASMKLAHETAIASRRTGRRLLSLARELSENPTLLEYAGGVKRGEAPGSYAVALGALCGAWGLSSRQAALVDLYSLVTGLLGAALRILSLDHVRSQAILHRLKARLVAEAHEAADTSYLDMWTFAPAVDFHQMLHERAELRLFAS